MKNEENYHTFGTVLKSKRKIVERGKIDTSNTNTYTFLAWYILLCMGPNLPVREMVYRSQTNIVNRYRSTTSDNIYSDKALHA